MKLRSITGGLVLTICSLSHAETLSFKSAWNRINANSAAQESSRLQTEALSEAQSRATRHWLPRIYLDAKSYQTNDPGASFLGLLEQRSLQQSDFSPDSINHPDTHIYTRGALGVDFPLFEGGLKSAQIDLYKHSVAAQQNSTSQIQIEQYSQVGLSYGSIIILELQKNKLQTLNTEITKMIKDYRLGSKSNPIGYSGLLGMKSLRNRLIGLISQYEAQSRSYYAILKEMGLKDTEWSPESLESLAFVNNYLSSQIVSSSSFKIENTKENVKVSEEMTNMEKAKFLPRVGVFAENYIFNSNRNTANGYNAGVYLQWSLFDPANYGSLRESKLKSLAAAKSSVASEQEERAERTALLESMSSLRENIALLSESHKILIEQSKMTETLFRNGSINALQIVEVLSRRADLIVQQVDTELSLIKTSSQIITKEKFNIEAHLGAKNEIH